MSHPEALVLAERAIDAAKLGDRIAVHRINARLVDWHRQRSDCPQVQARAARTIAELEQHLPGRPAESRRAHGALKRELLDALEAADQPLSIAELCIRLDVVKTTARNALERLVKDGGIIELSAQEHRRDLGNLTRRVFTPAGRVR